MNFLMASLIGHRCTLLDYDLACRNATRNFTIFIIRQFHTDTAAAQNFWLRPGPRVSHPGYASGYIPSIIKLKSSCHIQKIMKMLK